MDSKNISTKEKKSSFLYFFTLLIITIMYLLLECAFNATLLDVAGKVLNTEKIHAVEFWGRIISGLAVALAFCGSFLFPYFHKRNAAFFYYLNYGIIAFICLVSLTYYGQKELIDALGENSTPEQKKIATLASVASTQLREGDLLLQGFDLSEETRETPSAKAFIASFASIFSLLPNAEKIIHKELDDILKMYTLNTLGPVEKVYHEVYLPSREKLKIYFNEYGKGVMAYSSKLKNINKEAEKEWKKYVSEVNRKGVSVGKISSSFFPEARNTVRNRGLNVPSNWNPNNKKTFINVFKKQYREEAEKEALRQIRYKMPNNEELPLDLNNFDKFLDHKAIQDNWKKELNIPKHIKLGNMSLATFQKKVYTPLVLHKVTENKKMLLSKSNSFDSGKEYEEIGKRAFEGSIIFPLAMFLSILGIIVHLCKASFYMFRLIIPSKTIAIVINIVLFSFLIYLPMHYPTPITSSAVYNAVEEKLSEKHPLVASTARWILQAQTFIYTINESIREKVFLGMSFGIDEANKLEKQDTKKENTNG